MLRNILGSRLVNSARQKFTSDERNTRADEVVRLPVGKRLPEKRASWTSSTRLDDPLTGKISLILGSGTSSGANVNENTALGMGAVVACVQILAVMTAKLPIYLYRPSAKGPVEIENHPAIRLLGGVPSEFHTGFELRSLMQTGCGLGGNGYARVYRDRFFEPAEIEWLKPCEVNPEEVKRPSGQRFVRYDLYDVTEPLTRADIIHVRSPICTDGILGMSPIRMLRESIGTALTQTSAAGALMKNGARFPGVLTTDMILKEDQLRGMKEEWHKNTNNGMLGSTPILHGGLKFQATNGMSMVDAEFVESRRMEIHEVARHYGIPAFMVDSTATSTWGAGIEQQMLGFMNLSLDGWLVNWEESLKFTLLTREEQNAGFYFKFDRDQLANVAPATRAAFYTAMRNAGVYSPNDVRRKENEPLISKEDGGDSYTNPNIKQPTAPPAAQPYVEDVEDDPEPVTV